MNYSTNYNLNKPERNEQFNIDHWNNNTDAIDSQMHTNEVNIAQNATNIATLFTGLNTKNTSDADSVFYKLMKLIYPVGSLYWSSNPTNPGDLFGGTWVQIKDRFVLACGDTYTSSGATGGASTVTLSVDNMPSHNHTFTPSGKITMNSHSHGLNNHTHSFTPSGVISSSFAGTRATGTFGLVHSCRKNNNQENFSNLQTGAFSMNSYGNAVDGWDDWDRHSGTVKWDYTPAGKVSSSFKGSAGTTGVASGNTTSTTSTGSFSGTQGTTSLNGSGTAFNILPPYVVKYCWERTA